MKATITASIFAERHIDMMLGKQSELISAHTIAFSKKKQKNFVEIDKDSLLTRKAGASVSRK